MPKLATGILLVAALAALTTAGAVPARSVRPGACAAGAYSYAGLGSQRAAHGIAATLVPLSPPSVKDGEVAGWVGVAGTGGWIQVGLSAVSGPRSHADELYYEVAPPVGHVRYVDLNRNVRPGESRRVAVLEIGGRNGWWRVWVDNRPVSPPIHLAGSHDAWYPEAVGENMAGATGVCNRYAYLFTDVRLAQAAGGAWTPLGGDAVYEDPGYRFVQTSLSPRSFVAASAGTALGAVGL